jgi:hypothetical protein
MANEITLTASLSLTNGLLVVPNSSQTLQLDQTTARAGSFVQDIGTGEETITWGDVVPGVLKMTNLDTVNFCTWGNVTANLDQKLSANGGFGFVEMVSGGVIIVQADTAECKVMFEFFNI